MSRFGWSLRACVSAVSISLAGCSSTPDGLAGNPPDYVGQMRGNLTQVADCYYSQLGSQFSVRKDDLPSRHMVRIYAGGGPRLGFDAEFTDVGDGKVSYRLWLLLVKALTRREYVDEHRAALQACAQDVRIERSPPTIAKGPPG